MMGCTSASVKPAGNLSTSRLDSNPSPEGCRGFLQVLGSNLVARLNIVQNGFDVADTFPVGFKRVVYEVEELVGFVEVLLGAPSGSFSLAFRRCLTFAFSFAFELTGVNLEFLKILVHESVVLVFQEGQLSAHQAVCNSKRQ